MAWVSFSWKKFIEIFEGKTVICEKCYHFLFSEIVLVSVHGLHQPTPLVLPQIVDSFPPDWIYLNQKDLDFCLRIMWPGSHICLWFRRRQAFVGVLQEPRTGCLSCSDSVPCPLTMASPIPPSFFSWDWWSHAWCWQASLSWCLHFSPAHLPTTLMFLKLEFSPIFWYVIENWQYLSTSKSLPLLYLLSQKVRYFK